MFKRQQILRTRVPVFGLKPGTRVKVLAMSDCINSKTHIRAKVLDTPENIVKPFAINVLVPTRRGRPRKTRVPATVE